MQSGCCVDARVLFDRVDITTAKNNAADLSGISADYGRATHSARGGHIKFVRIRLTERGMVIQEVACDIAAQKAPANYVLNVSVYLTLGLWVRIAECPNFLPQKQV